MISAYNLGMVSGDYVFISFHPFNNTKTFGDDSWNQVKTRGSPCKNVWEEIHESRIRPKFVGTFLNTQKGHLYNYMSNYL